MLNGFKNRMSHNCDVIDVLKRHESHTRKINSVAIIKKFFVTIVRNDR